MELVLAGRQLVEGRQAGRLAGRQNLGEVQIFKPAVDQNIDLSFYLAIVQLLFQKVQCVSNTLVNTIIIYVARLFYKV